MNTQILNYLINTQLNNTPDNKDIMSVEQYNRELKTFSYNLGRRSGKTYSIINSAKDNPNINFLVLFYNQNKLDDFKTKAKTSDNIKCILFNPNSFDNLQGILSNYQVIVLDDYSYHQRKNSTALLEEFLYKRLNSNNKQHQILVKLG